MKEGGASAKKGEGKKEEGLYMFDAKLGVKRTVLQKVHYACRKAYLLSKPLNQLRRPDGVVEREWRRYLGYYEIAPDAPYTIRKVSEEVGLGVFATAPLSKGKVMGLRGIRGRVAAGVKAGTSMIKVLVAYPNPAKSKYVEDKVVEREVCYYLRGAVSFLNGACLEHANCDPHVGTFQPYERIKTRREIAEGEELLISYGKGNFSDKLCGECRDSKKTKRMKNN
jgi:hypothetical protein